LNKIADGIGHKFASFQYCIAGFICGYILGFFYGWILTLVILSLFPVIALSGGFLGWVRRLKVKKTAYTVRNCFPI
jgi:ABC-type multidrug transport system fused ATPase/permease subunit